MADAIPTLSISTEKICFVVLKAREFDVKDADTSSDEDGSNPADDRMVEVLENRPDDPVDQELVAFTRSFSYRSAAGVRAAKPRTAYATFGQAAKTGALKVLIEA